MCGTPAELGNNANKVEAIKKKRFCLYFQLYEEATCRRKTSFYEANYQLHFLVNMLSTN